MFGPTLVYAMSVAAMKLTLLPHVLLWICSFALIRSALAVSLVLQFGGTFSWLQIRRSKFSLFLVKFLLDLGAIAVCHAK